MVTIKKLRRYNIVTLSLNLGSSVDNVIILVCVLVIKYLL